MINETLYLGTEEKFGRYLVFKNGGNEMFEKDIDGDVKESGGYVKTGPDDFWGTLVLDQKLYGFFHNATVYEDNHDLVFWQSYIGPNQGRARVYVKGVLKEEAVYNRFAATLSEHESDLDWFFYFAQRHKPRQAAFPDVFNSDGTLRD